VRVYIEAFEPSPAKQHQPTPVALAGLVHIAIHGLADLAGFIHRTEPTVIT
jgi:hypothetical protein